MITLKHEVHFIAAEVGFSAWVHVNDGPGDDYAVHCGYYNRDHDAQLAAFNRACDLQKAFAYVNVPSRKVAGRGAA